MKDMNTFSRDRFNSEVDDWSNYHKTRDIISWERAKRYDITIDVLEKYKGKKISILEIGCGAGANINQISLQDSNWTCTGVDISNEMIDYCKKTYKQKNISFSVCNIEEKVLTKQYDVVILLGVVGYFNNNKKAFDNIVQAVKPAGELLFTYGSNESLFRKLRYLGVWVLHNKLFLGMYNYYKRKILGEKKFSLDSSVFSAYTKRSIHKLLQTKRFAITREIAICFAAGYFRKLSVAQSNFFERLFRYKDPLHLAMTKIIIARHKK